MSRALPALVLFLGAALPVPGAAPPPAGAGDRIDFVFLGSTRPYLIRFHVRVGDKPYGAEWDAFTDRLFAWFDRDGDGTLSKAEAARLPRGHAVGHLADTGVITNEPPVPFADIDANKDGKVSRAEFRNYYDRNGLAGVACSFGNSGPAEVRRINDAILNRLDRKGDGRLTAAKVARFYEKLRALDENGDEALSREELTPAAVAGGDQPDFRLEERLQRIRPEYAANLAWKIFGKYGRNKRGGLTRREIGLDEAAFARLDTDKDGSLSYVELWKYASGEPDFVFRIQLGPSAPRPAGSRVTLVNAKGIDPVMKKKFRRGPGDACHLELDGVRLAFHPHPEKKRELRVEGLREYYFDLYDKASGKKGHVTREDLKAAGAKILLAIFPQADKNADGKLTRGEIIAWLDFAKTARDAGLAVVCQDHGRSLFDVLDTDGDERLTLREMRSAWERLGPLAKDGSVGRGDLPRTIRIDFMVGNAHAFSASAPGSARWQRAIGLWEARPKTPPWFDKMDKNNDGDISPREWLGTDEEFKAIDADGDGLISVAEALAFEAKKKK